MSSDGSRLRALWKEFRLLESRVRDLEEDSPADRSWRSPSPLAASQEAEAESPEPERSEGANSESVTEAERSGADGRGLARAGLEPIGPLKRRQTGNAAREKLAGSGA